MSELKEKIKIKVTELIHKFLGELQNVRNGAIKTNFDLSDELYQDKSFWTAFYNACYENNISWTTTLSDNFGDWFFAGTIQRIHE